MFTKAFWKEAAERAIKTAAQVVLTFIGLDGAGLLGLNWTVAGVGIAGAALASFVTSVISSATPVGQITPNTKTSAPAESGVQVTAAEAEQYEGRINGSL